MHDFISIENGLPEDGQEVEAFRVYGLVRNHLHHAHGCTCGVERTTYDKRYGFYCDITSTGSVTHWKPAQSLRLASVDDYPGLRDLLTGGSDSSPNAGIER